MSQHRMRFVEQCRCDCANCGQHRLYPCADIGMAARGVGMNDIGIANINDPHRFRQVSAIVFMVIGPGMAKAEQRRGLAHRARPKAGTGAKLRARVKGRAHHRHIGVDLGPVLHIGALAKGGDPDKGQVQPPRFIAMP